jgi:hypothetical protein
LSGDNQIAARDDQELMGTHGDDNGALEKGISHHHQTETNSFLHFMFVGFSSIAL